ncbi:cbb3-type cytochrome c oxidase subunit I [Candidatus Methylacidiphilum infernorum]|nr:cbb3-type cytochrome c oxidase subunit I [Candidatus Methylacidiphilum infernorum]ABX56670.1 putative nitric oxide reductase B subunit [Methylacidiphilum infernorum V4]
MKNPGILYESQKLALWYWALAVVLFGFQLIFGLIISYQYLQPEFLHKIFNFSVGRLLHLNAMILWLLFGFIGGIYWFLPLETQREIVGLFLGKMAFVLIAVAVGIVVGVFLLVQIGKADWVTLWFITEGREYIEAPRWADIGIVAVFSIIFFNVLATIWKAQKLKGILWVLTLDLLAIIGFYIAGMFFTPNISVDQFWWWWVVHLWVEATWEVLVGVLVAWVLMAVLDTPRKILEGWLYLEVFLVFGTGILGLGHHYFWIGAPEYWLGIGGFFSALEPLPLVAMVVHAVYDAGMHRLTTTNKPAFFWIVFQSFGNFLGAGVWGFMHTLPQINLYSHGTQITAAHGHLAFFGAYVATNIAMIYTALQKIRLSKGGNLDGRLWRWTFVGFILSIFGITAPLTVAGFAQTFIERAVGGSTWQAYINGQLHPWVKEAMAWRFGFGIMFFICYLMLVIDLCTIGKQPVDKENTHCL